MPLTGTHGPVACPLVVSVGAATVVAANEQSSAPETQENQAAGGAPQTGASPDAPSLESKPQPGAAPDNRGHRSVWLRISWLLVLVLIAEWWCRRHLGVSFWSLISAGLAALVLCAIGGIYSYVQGETAWEKVRQKGSRWLISPGVLTLLSVAMFITGCFVSSVAVLADGVEGSFGVRVQRETPTTPNEKPDKPDWTLVDREAVVHCPRFVLPFGTRHSLKVDGYQREGFRLYPWVGTRFSLKHDLKVEPNVVLLVPPRKQMLLKVGRVRIWHRRDADWMFLGEVRTTADNGSVLVGGRTKIPPELVTRWKEKLIASGLPDSTVSMVALNWSQPVIVNPTEPILAGDKLAAVFLSGDDSPQACAEFTVESEALWDELLTNSEEENDQCMRFSTFPSPSG